MDKTIAYRNRRLLRRLLFGFGAISLVSSIVAAFILDELVIDVGALIVIWLSTSVARGSPRAAKWSGIIMACYFAGAALLLTVGIIAPERMNIAGRAIRPGELPYALLSAAIAGSWAFINLALLWKHRAAFSPAAQIGA